MVLNRVSHNRLEVANQISETSDDRSLVPYKQIDVFSNLSKILTPLITTINVIESREEGLIIGREFVVPEKVSASSKIISELVSLNRFADLKESKLDFEAIDEPTPNFFDNLNKCFNIIENETLSEETSFADLREYSDTFAYFQNDLGQTLVLNAIAKKIFIVLGEEELRDQTLVQLFNYIKNHEYLEGRLVKALLGLLKSSGSYLRFIQMKLILGEAYKSNFITEQELEYYTHRVEVLLQFAHNGNALLMNATDAQKNDKEIVMAAVSGEWYALKYASDNLKNDREFVLSLVRIHGCTFQFASIDLQNDMEIVRVAVGQFGRNLAFASNKLQNNRELVLIAVRNDGLSLQFASKELQNDKDIVLVAIKNNPSAVQFASSDLKNDREVILQVVNVDGTYLNHASSDLKDDYEIVLEAVKNKGSALQFASKKLQNNWEIVYTAVSKDGMALKYAGDTLKNDEKIVFRAVSKNGYALQFANDRLKSDESIVFTAVSDNGYALKFAKGELNNNKKIVISAVKRNGFAIQYASTNLQKDKDILRVVDADH